MKRTTLFIVAAIAAALAVGAMMGCSSQQASQDDLIAEYKDALANVPECESVTVAVEDSATFPGEDEIVETSIYKFDASGDTLKTSIEVDASGVALKYYTDGDDAVFVSDGPVYSGTAEQFDLVSAQGFQAFLDDAVGDLNVLADCTTEIEKMESNGLTAYFLTLDPQKYTESDEALSMLAEYGTVVQEATFTVSFDEDGTIASVDQNITYEDSTKYKGLIFSDYGSTVVDPMPEADKTYEDMEADMEAKFNTIE